MTNRLAGETSPYLLQHAENPVDWYPWGPEALERARQEGKPVLLSVGYSACHWCHVMAHESFEDRAVAAVMNDLFVNVKVDREERPDIDQIYQLAHALLSRRSGGWPLTMFLTPDGEPFYGGTYYPKHGRHGLQGFLDLLPRIAAAWREQGAAIAEQNGRLRDAFAGFQPEATEGGDTVPASAPVQALAALKLNFDPEWGGFGSAPKFPHPAELEFCLQAYARDGDADALNMVEVSLRRMAEGGIHDQLGGGFCRYSVDGEWSIPHFEKMLYDNGPLLGLYADTARITGNEAYAEAARGIVAWMTREMRAGDGAFYSSLDADSEGEEGKFYVWNDDEVRGLLDADTFPLVEAHYGLDRPPNFEGHAWNLRVAVGLDDVAERLGLSLPDAQTRLRGAKATLFAHRERRVHPGLDDKILTSWNALAITGLARATRALDQPGWADIAFAAADSLRATIWRDGRLLATRKGIRAHLNAYLDDYAFLLAALLELMQTRFRKVDLEWARALAEVILAQFEDAGNGGFFFTSHDHEELIHRMKPGADNATPSGNGVAARALIALGHLAAEPKYIEAAERTIRLFAADIARSPSGHSSLLMATADLQRPPTSVLLAGDAAECASWQRALERIYRPQVSVFDVAGVTDVPALIKGELPTAGATAWVCDGSHCLPPINSLAELEQKLAEPDRQ